MAQTDGSSSAGSHTSSPKPTVEASTDLSWTLLVWRIAPGGASPAESRLSRSQAENGAVTGETMSTSRKLAQKLETLRSRICLTGTGILHVLGAVQIRRDNVVQQEHPPMRHRIVTSVDADDPSARAAPVYNVAALSCIRRWAVLSF